MRIDGETTVAQLLDARPGLGEALRGLFTDDTPARGAIEVVVGGAPDDGGAGPMAQVIALVTGAAPETGFSGLMGRFRRRGLLRFESGLAGRVRFRRTDTGAAVDVLLNPRAVPSPDLPALLAAVMAGRASPDERRRFADLWQARVERMLTTDAGLVAQVRRAD